MRVRLRFFGAAAPALMAGAAAVVPAQEVVPAQAAASTSNTVTSVAVAAQQATPAQTAAAFSVRDGVYTAEQADRGEVLYDDQCAVCHGAIRAIIPEMAALLGDYTFRNTWRGRSLGEMFGYIQETMPQDAPDTLTSAQTAEIVAHILRGNRLPAGETALPADEEALNAIPFDP